MSGSVEADEPPRRAVGDADVWLFILADMGGFAVLFALFVFARADAPELFEAGRRRLDLALGLLNTIILVSSGALVAGAAHAARRGDWRRADRRLRGSLAVGAGFAVVKAIEWGTEVRRGITLNTDAFFGYHFALTGIHFLHYVIGVAVLVALIGVGRSRRAPAERLRWLEAGGAYWHMVDLLWIVLFALLYLMRAA